MKRFALFGHNIDYSLSPKIHSMIYDFMGVQAEYGIVSAEPEKFPKALNELFALDGFNVTKPYKQRIADFVDTVDGGWDAVNTVVLRMGRRIGYNTDYYGFKTHFLKIVDPKDYKVLVLGAGGVAEIVVPTLIALGADVYVYNRTTSKSEELCARHGATAVSDKSGRYGIVVNCTSLGLGEGENPGCGMDFSETFVAYDTIYFKTEFLKTAQAAGVPFAEDGLAMLIYQAIRADEIFFDTKITDKEGLFEKIFKELRKET